MAAKIKRSVPRFNPFVPHHAAAPMRGIDGREARCGSIGDGLALVMRVDGHKRADGDVFATWLDRAVR
ncbi:MAG: hypothetical protein ACLPVY_23765 [Acidimicrobiia bacterium]